MRNVLSADAKRYFHPSEVQASVSPWKVGRLLADFEFGPLHAVYPEAARPLAARAAAG